MSIVMLAAALGFWNLLLGPIQAANHTTPVVVQILSLSYPVGDFLLLWATLLLIYHHSKGQRPGATLLLVGGATLMLITDCSFSYESLIGNNTSGGILYFGWVVAYLTFGLAGMLQADGIRPSEKKAQEGLPEQPALLPAWISCLPYAWLAGAYLLCKPRKVKPTAR
jgi:hypothetical protein